MSDEQNTEDGQSTSSEETPDATTLSRDALKAIASGESLEDQPEVEGEAAEEEKGEENKEGAEGGEGGESSDGDGQEGESEEEDEMSSLRATIAASEDRIEKQSKLLDKIGTELGLLRKTTPEEEKAKLDEIRDAYLEDPIEGDRLLREYREGQKAEVSQSREEEISQIIDDNRSVVTGSAPEFEQDIEANVSGIAELLEADGASKETLEAFKENPYVIDGSTLFALHKRNQVVSELKEVKDQLAERDAEIAKLKKKPGEVLDKIANATKLKTLTGKDGSSSPGGTEQGGAKKVVELSRAELKKIANGG